MGPRGRLRQGFVLGAVSCAGIALAHWAAYLLAVPDAHRHELLEATGHSYWQYFLAIAVGLLLGGVTCFVGSRFSTPTDPARDGMLLRSWLLRLAPLQVTGFIAIEVGERLLSAHGSHESLLSQPVFWVGIAIQLVTALLGSLLLVILGRAVDIIRDFVHGRPTPTSGTPLPQWVTEQVVRPALQMIAGGLSFRGPPAFSY